MLHLADPQHQPLMLSGFFIRVDSYRICTGTYSEFTNEYFR